MSERFQKVKGSTIVRLSLVVQMLVRLGLRTRVIEDPSQDIFFCENIAIKIADGPNGRANWAVFADAGCCRVVNGGASKLLGFAGGDFGMRETCGR